MRRAEIIDAATVKFAETGLAGTGLESIAMRAGISHPRVVQMFGSKRALFLAVVDANFDRLEALFASVAPAGQHSELSALGDAYRRLLQVRTFFATGMVVTLSTALALPGRRTDATWGGWLLQLVDPVAPPRGI